MRSLLTFLQIVETLFRWAWAAATHPHVVGWMIIGFGTIARLGDSRLSPPSLWEYLAAGYPFLHYRAAGRKKIGYSAPNVNVESQTTVQIVNIGEGKH